METKHVVYRMICTVVWGSEFVDLVMFGHPRNRMKCVSPAGIPTGAMTKISIGGCFGWHCHDICFFARRYPLVNRHDSTWYGKAKPNISRWCSFWMGDFPVLFCACLTVLTRVVLWHYCIPSFTKIKQRSACLWSLDMTLCLTYHQSFGTCSTQEER